MLVPARDGALLSARDGALLSAREEGHVNDQSTETCRGRWCCNPLVGLNETPGCSQTTTHDSAVMMLGSVARLFNFKESSRPESTQIKTCFPYPFYV